MNYLWGGMIVIGVIYGAVTGRLDAVTDQALSSAKEAVTLCITMAGVMAFWVGIMRIAERAGMVEQAARKLNPVMNFLFPSVPKASAARTYMATNMVANFLGLGWAATPAAAETLTPCCWPAMTSPTRRPRSCPSPGTPWSTCRGM